MKINSITTEYVDKEGRVLAYSKTTFKKKPEFHVKVDLFDELSVDIRRHLFSPNNGASVFLVTVRTSEGKFIRTYRGGFP